VNERASSRHRYYERDERINRHILISDNNNMINNALYFGSVSSKNDKIKPHHRLSMPI
jgi:hypothetical protein